MVIHDPVILTEDEQRHLAFSKGGKKRHGRHDEAAQIGQRLEVASLADHILRVVEAWPPPTPEQVQRLRELLPPVRPDQTAASRREAA